MASPSTTDSSISCSVQAHLPAAAFCTVCRRPYAGRFLSVLNDGRAVCFRCASDSSLATLGEDEPLDTSAGDPAFQHGLLRAVPFILLKPARAIGSTPYKGRIGPAVRFGYLAALVGRLATVGWLFTLNQDAATKAIQARMDQMGAELSADDLRTALWTSLPIAVFISMAVGVVLFHVGLRLCGARDGSFREHARAYALGSCALLFGLLPPPLGLPLICLAWMSAMMVWTRARYGFTGVRATLAMMPALLLMLLF